MGGFLGFGAGFANAASQARAQQPDPIDQALKLYQLRQALQQDPLRQALLNKQIAEEGKQIIQTPSGPMLVNMTEPNAAPVPIGPRTDYGGDLKSLLSAAPQPLRPLIQSGIDSKDPAYQQQVLKTAQDAIGRMAGQKPTEMEQYLSNPPAYTAMKTAGKEPKAIKWLSSRDAEGHSISIPTDAVTGARLPGVAPVPGKLGVAETAALEATRSLIIDIPKLQDAAKKIAGGSPFKAFNEYRKYAHPVFGFAGTVDPVYEDYFSQIGNIKSELARLQTSGSSRSMQLLRFIQDHLPKETDPPAVALRKLQTLEAGRLSSLTKAILDDDPVAASSGPPDLSKMTADVGTPVYDSSGRVTTFKPVGAPRDTP